MQYLQAWGGISIWKAVWDLWTYFILPGDLWARVVIAHVCGLLMLLLTFSFRSAVTPPMIFVEDTILTGKRKKRRGKKEEEVGFF